MRKWTGLALFLTVAIAFLAANRGAYRGFFSADEFDNLGWTPVVPGPVYAKALVSPAYQVGNFRPAGHLYFHVMSKWFGVDFPKYLIFIHLFHLLAVWLLWMLLRALGASWPAACAGTLFFVFHVAVLDIYWEPMYVFDLLCGVFCLASLLFWVKGRWVLSFLSFWLAYKSKELAVMLPAVLVCYELWLGKRRWKILAPFLAVSLWFGVQGIFQNPNRDNDYTFRYTPAALAATSQFYAEKLFLIPYAGFALLALPALSRDRRVWLGVAAALLLMVPLLLLPGRLYSAYWYVPLIGVAVALGALADTRARVYVAVLLALWIPWSYVQLRHKLGDKLTVDAENRSYFKQLKAASPGFQDIPVFISDGAPPAFPSWGVGGAVRCLSRLYPQVYSMDDPASREILRRPAVSILKWVEARRRLYVRTRHADTPDASYVTVDDRTPLWQLTDGWSKPEDGFAWIAPRATARLLRPAGATVFEAVVNVSGPQLASVGHCDLRVLLNGAQVGTAHLTQAGVQTLRWPVKDAAPGSVNVEFEVDPVFHPAWDPRALGMAIVGFGFRADAEVKSATVRF